MIKLLNVPKGEWSVGITIERMWNVFEKNYRTYIAIGLIKHILCIGVNL